MPHYDEIMRMDDDAHRRARVARMKVVLEALREARNNLALGPHDRPIDRVHRIGSHVDDAIDLVLLDIGRANDGFLPD